MLESSPVHPYFEEDLPYLRVERPLRRVFTEPDQSLWQLAAIHQDHSSTPHHYVGIYLGTPLDHYPTLFSCPICGFQGHHSDASVHRDLHAPDFGR